MAETVVDELHQHKCLTDKAKETQTHTETKTERQTQREKCEREGKKE